MKITTENIQVGFHARQILKGISIESQDKELVGIIGPNGSGKSTLLKCIYRILKPDAGAVYLDGEMDAASDLIHRVLLDKEREEVVEERRRDYKTELQELVQRRSGQVLHYELTGTSGPDHAKQFTFRVTLNGREIGQGTGRSKKEAEQSAARSALAQWNEQ